MEYAKIKLKIWMLILISTAVVRGSVCVANSDFFSPHFGLDLGYKHFRLKQYFGGNALKKTYPFYNIFVGTNFNESFGIELGAEKSDKKTKEKTFFAQDKVYGIQVTDNNEPVSTVSSAKTYGFYLSFTYKHPVPSCKRLNFFSSFGLKRSSFKVRSNIMQYGGGDLNLEQNFSKTKIVPRISFGTEYLFNKQISGRILAVYEDNSKIEQRVNLPLPILKESNLRLKNSIGVCVGVIVKCWN